jgi:carbon monoxide dehydrogenase subunit G
MATAVSHISVMGMQPPASTVTSMVELSAYVAAPPERVWGALRSFDSKSTAGLLKVLYQETDRRLVYAVSGLPRNIKHMVGHVHLQPDGAGTWLHWSLRFSTSRTLIARLFRPLMRAGIARTLRDAAQRFQAAVEQAA